MLNNVEPKEWGQRERKIGWGHHLYLSLWKIMRIKAEYWSRAKRKRCQATNVFAICGIYATVRTITDGSGRALHGWWSNDSTNNCIWILKTTFERILPIDLFLDVSYRVVRRYSLSNADENTTGEKLFVTILSKQTKKKMQISKTLWEFTAQCPSWCFKIFHA